MTRWFFLFLVGLLTSSASHSQTTDSVDFSSKKALLDSIFLKLNQYVFTDKAKQIKSAIKHLEGSLAFRMIGRAQVLADSLNSCFVAASQDKHLKIYYSPDTTNHGDAVGRFARLHNNGFDKVEIFPGNIGYMRIIGFFASPFSESMRAAFDMVDSTDGLIIDLTNNGGGEMETALLAISHLFKDQIDLFDMRLSGQSNPEQHWSSLFTPGAHYLDKPVYVLTSHSTFSAAEAFAYCLQAEKRATIVGETTRGGANITELVRMPGGFLLSLPVGSPVEPKTQSNWEGVGVKPDISTTAERSLLEAYRAVLMQCEGKVADINDKQDIERILNGLPK